MNESLISSLNNSVDEPDKWRRVAVSRFPLGSDPDKSVSSCFCKDTCFSPPLWQPVAEILKPRLHGVDYEFIHLSLTPGGGGSRERLL